MLIKTFYGKSYTKSTYVVRLLCVWSWTDQCLVASNSKGFLPFSWLYTALFQCCAGNGFFWEPFPFVNPAGDLSPFPRPFSEWGFGNGENESLCLGGSELLGWLTFVYLKCTCRKTLILFVDASFPLWQRCPAVVSEMAGRSLMKSLSVSLLKANGHKPCWQTDSVAPSPSKVIP